MNEKDIAIIIPWRSQPKRIYAFNKLINWYKENYNNVEIIVSDSDTNNFSLSRSRNLGAQEAISKGYNILIFNDADAFIEKKYLDLAIKNSIKNKEITVPFSFWIQSISEKENNMLLNKNYNIDNFSEVFFRPIIMTNKKINQLHPCSGSIVVPSYIYKKINGFDEKINSWGPEDILFHQKYISYYKKPFRYTKGLCYTIHDYKEQRDITMYKDLRLYLDNFIEKYTFSKYVYEEYNKSIDIK